MPNEYKEVEDTLSNALSREQDLSPEATNAMDERVHNTINTLKTMQNENEVQEKLSFFSKVNLGLFATRKRKFATFSAALLLLLPLTLVMLYVFTNGSGPSFRREILQDTASADFAASKVTGDGVAQDSDFVLRTETKYEEVDLRTKLKISPAFDFKVEKVSEGYKIVPSSDLQKNVLYDVEFKDKDLDLDWNFRVEPGFSVLSHSPAESSAPLNSVIEFNFNYADIDLDSVRAAFKSYPLINIKSIEQQGRTVILVPESEFSVNSSYSIYLNNTAKRLNGEVLSTPYSGYISMYDSTKVNNYPPSIFFGNDQDNNLLRADRKIVFSISDPVGNSKGNFKVYKVKNEAYLEAAREYLSFRETYQLFKIDGKYMDEIKSEEFTAASDIVMTVPEIAKGEVIYVEVNYKGVIKGTYYISTGILSHMTDMQNEFVLNAFDSNGKVITDGTAEIIFRDNNNVVQNKSFPLKGITKINKSELPFKDRILGAVVSANSDRLILSITSSYVPTETNFESSDYYSPDSGYSENVFSYFMMDKPVYTQGDKVRFKALFRYSEDFTNFGVYDVSGIEFIYSNYSGIVKRSKPDYNKDSGYITGEFSIPTSAEHYMSGSIRIVKGNKTIATNSFPIREYVRPEYTVNLSAKDSLKVYRPGDEVEYRVSVTDLAGNPLSGGEVEAQFGYSERYRYAWIESIPTAYNYLNDSVETKLVKLDSGGHANLKFKIGTPKVSDISDFYSAVVQISINKHSTKALGVMASLGDLTVMAENVDGKYWKMPGEEAVFHIKAVDSQSLTGVSTVINKLEVERNWIERIPYTFYNSATRTNETSYSYNPHTEIVDTQYNLQTDQNGDIELVRKYELEGSYNFKFEFKDRSNRVVNYSTYMLEIFPKNGGGGYQRSSNPSISLDKKIYKVGDKVNVRIEFPDTYVDGRDAYIFLYKDKIYKEEKISINQKTYSYSYDLTKEMSPQAGIRLVYTLPISEFGEEYKDQGYKIVETQEVGLVVRRDEDLLKVEIQSDKKEFSPGEKVTMKVKVTDENGRSVSGANLNLRIFDKTLLAVIDQDSYQKDIYNKVFGTYTRVGSLFTYPKAPYSGDGGDGGEAPDGIRRNFDNVATFQSDLITDSSGMAEVTFTFPETITTWVVDADAFTKKLNVGNSFMEMTTNKTIILSSTLPESVRVGDKLTPKVTISNNSDANVSGKLTITSTDGIEVKNNSQDVTIGSKTSGLFSFEAEAKAAKNNNSKLTIKFADQDGKVIDGIEKSIQLRTSGYPASQVSADKLKSSENQIKFNLKGQLENSTGSILISPDSYRFAFYKKDFMINSTEERTSSIVHNIALYDNFQKGQDVIPIGKETLLDEIVLSLSALAEFQNEDGGFGMFSYSSSDINNSSYAAYALGRASQSGISVTEINSEELVKYLIGQVSNEDGHANDKTTSSDKVLAIWALSYLDPSRSISFAQSIKNQLSGDETLAEFSLLADALYVSGSQGDARLLTQKLLKDLKSNNLNQNYLEEEKQPYSENKYFANIFLWKMLNKLKIDSNAEEKLGNWFMENSLQEKAFESGLVNEMILSFGVSGKKVETDITVVVNDVEIYKGKLSGNGDNFILSNLKVGENVLKVTSGTNNLHYRLRISEVSNEQIVSTDDFIVKTEYMPLETMKASHSLPSSQYTVVRVSVTSKKENKGYYVKTYIPAGTTAGNAIPSLYGSSAYNKWMTSRNYTNKWPQVSNGSLLFNGYYDVKKPTQVFEYLLVTDHKGVYGTDGTYVYYEDDTVFRGYEPGKTITIN